ncbi:hypothetical protein MPL3365_130529 [Mesorhizobium plurifarium]|uniref:Uncharacterized protein n=1 Tax=Mesorhizobium plurifarium TaxID=69974 RepID=A0A090FWW7_MESPL|nr:hypothetical protein MPL3365_130529 [Mesorhizobium plurifarium]
MKLGGLRRVRRKQKLVDFVQPIADLLNIIIELVIKHWPRPYLSETIGKVSAGLLGT